VILMAGLAGPQAPLDLPKRGAGTGFTRLRTPSMTRMTATTAQEGRVEEIRDREGSKALEGW